MKRKYVIVLHQDHVYHFDCVRYYSCFRGGFTGDFYLADKYDTLKHAVKVIKKLKRDNDALNYGIRMEWI
jgi:hypothetical protein